MPASSWPHRPSAVFSWLPGSAVWQTVSVDGRSSPCVCWPQASYSYLRRSSLDGGNWAPCASSSACLLQGFYRPWQEKKKPRRKPTYVDRLRVRFRTVLHSWALAGLGQAHGHFCKQIDLPVFHPETAVACERVLARKPYIRLLADPVPRRRLACL
jgi:hypothetical protein